MNSAATHKLAALGLFTGSTVMVRQRSRAQEVLSDQPACSCVAAATVKAVSWLSVCGMAEILLHAMQEVLARNLAQRTKTPLVVVLVHGGALDVSWLQHSSRIGAVMTAWYPGQVHLLMLPA